MKVVFATKDTIQEADILIKKYDLKALKKMSSIFKYINQILLMFFCMKNVKTFFEQEIPV